MAMRFNPITGKLDVIADGGGGGIPFPPGTGEKGDILVYDGTQFVYLPVGPDTYILTADSGEDEGISWQPPASGSFQSLAPFIVGNNFANYSTIQAALDAAALLLPTADNIQNIYVKPKGSPYAEDLVIPPFVKIIGFDASGNVDNQFAIGNSVRIQGSHTLPSTSGDRFYFQNVQLEADTDEMWVGADTDVYGVIINCRIVLGWDGNATNYASVLADGAVSLEHFGCNFRDQAFASTYFTSASLPADGALSYYFTDCQLIGYGNSTLDGADGTFELLYTKSDIQFSMILTDGASYNEQGNFSRRIFSTSEADINANISIYQSEVSGSLDVTAIGGYLFDLCNVGSGFTGLTPTLKNCSNVCDYSGVASVAITAPFTTTLYNNMVNVDTTGGAVAITMYATPYDGMTQTIKDVGGDAGTNNITIIGDVDSNAGGMVIDQDFGAVTLVWNLQLSTWNVKSAANQGGGGGSFQSLAPFIVGSSFANYSTIQDAIDAAVLAGADTTNQLNVYIKAKGSAYTEDLALAAGVNLVGFDEGVRMSNTYSFEPTAVIIIGNHTVPTDGFTKIQNVTMGTSGGSMFDFPTTARIVLINCFLVLAYDFTIDASLVSTSNPSISAQLLLNNTSVKDGTGNSTLFDNATLDTDATVDIRAFSSSLISVQGDNAWDHGSVEIDLDGSTLLGTFTGTGTSTFSMGLVKGSYFASTTSVLDTVGTFTGDSSNVGGSISVGAATSYVFFNCGISLDITGTTVQPRLLGCEGACAYHKPALDILVANYTTTVLDDLVPVDTTGGVVAITLYASPFAGMTQTIQDVSGAAVTNAITITGNVNGSAGGTTIDTAYGSKTLCWDADVSSWLVVSEASVGGGGGSFQSLAPFIVGSAFANYATIQAAIDAAVLLTPNTSSQINIYIKSKGSDYTENLDLTGCDGINLIGFDGASLGDYINSDNNNSVKIVGTHTVPAEGQGRIKFVNLQLYKDDGIMFNLTDSTGQVSFNFDFVDCTVYVDDDDDRAYLFYGGAFALPTFTFTNCLLTGGGVLFRDDQLHADFQGVTISTNNCNYQITGSSTASKGGFTFAGAINNYFTLTLNLSDASTLAFYESNSAFNTINITCDNLIDSAISNCFVRLGQFNVNGGQSPLFTGCAFSPNFVMSYGGTVQPVFEDCSGTSGYAKVTAVQTSAYTTLITDNLVPVDVTAGAVAITLFASPFDGMTQTIKNVAGNPVADNITIIGNVDSSAGGTSIVTAKGSVTLTYNLSLATWMIKSRVV